MPSDAISDEIRPMLADALLAGADDDLFIGHAASDWTGLGPLLEEDIAFSSIAQDEVAHARELYTLVGEFTGKSSDDLAFGRAPADYRCAALTLLSDDFDWSMLIVRQFYYDHFDALRVARWSHSSHAPLAHLARRIAAEEMFHRHHVNDWLARLGRGTDEARERAQTALTNLWPAVVALFEPTGSAEHPALHGLIPGRPSDLADHFVQNITAAIQSAGLRAPASSLDVTHAPAGGRRGLHPPSFAAILDELSEVYRLDPRAKW